jgi:hypothetical protein
MREFRRIDADGNGTLSKVELGLFFRKALCYKITVQELNTLFGVLDLDGDGTISLDEFMSLFCRCPLPKKKVGAGKTWGGGASEELLGEVYNADRVHEMQRRIVAEYGTDCGLFAEKAGCADTSPRASALSPITMENLNFDDLL